MKSREPHEVGGFNASKRWPLMRFVCSKFLLETRETLCKIPQQYSKTYYNTRLSENGLSLMCV
jgi:hypothetical protein